LSDKAYVQQLEAENALLKATLGQLMEYVKELEVKVEELSKKVDQQSVKKNSNNSHLPPSGDVSRKTRSLRKDSGKRPGGQKGHKGHNLKLSSNPDEIEKLIPNQCQVCFEQLDGALGILVERRQVVDIPPIVAQIKEYQCYQIRCACGHHQRGAFPHGVDNHIQYGPRITALAVYHNIYQYIPYHRLQQFFAQICQVRLSVGTLENMVARTAQKARPLWEALRQQVEQARVVGSDETGAKVNGKKQWVWVWQSTLVTFLAVCASRGAELVEKLFPEGFVNATLCSDRWHAQIKTGAKKHQLCLAHLLRELLYLIEAEKTDWAQECKTILLEAIRLKQTQAVYDLDHPSALAVEQQLDQLLKQDIVDRFAIKTLALKKSLTKYRDMIFPFLYDPDVPFDNNASERSIRNFKVKLKVSGQFKSGQEHYCILRSIIDSAIKNRQDVFEAISQFAILKSPPLATSAKK